MCSGSNFQENTIQNQSIIIEIKIIILEFNDKWHLTFKKVKDPKEALPCHKIFDDNLFLHWMINWTCLILHQSKPTILLVKKHAFGEKDKRFYSSNFSQM